jgi:hypothetical protein
MFSSACCLFSCHDVDCDNIEEEIKSGYYCFVCNNYLNLKAVSRVEASSDGGTSGTNILMNIILVLMSLI